MLVKTGYAEVYGRIQHVTGARTQTQVGEILEIRQSSISDAKRRDQIPAEWYMTLFEKLGVNPDWLKYGSGPKFLRTEAGYFPTNKENGTNIDLKDFSSSLIKPVYAPVFSMNARIENNIISHIKIGNIVLPQEYLHGKILVFQSNNNAFAPIINKKSYVGIDTLQKELIIGKIFGVMILNEGIILGQLFFDELLSQFEVKNNYKTYKINSEKISERLIGKVSWFLQNL